MTFYDWMQERYSGKDTPRGDLAADMKHELKYDRYPAVENEETLKFHLSKQAALFKRCWKDYKAAQK